MTSTSEQGYQNLTLCVPRRSSLPASAGPAEHLANPTVVSSHVQDVGVGGVIPPNHVLLRVERFGFSANNVTYGLLGEDPHFRYFEFHPAPATNGTSPKTHGVIPVWGFATVIQSTHPSIQNGERVFGYLGMSRYLVLPVETIVNKYNFYVPRPHLPSDRRPYNQITRCNADPLYDPKREDELMIFRPLFWTSFWCEDWLHTTGAFNSESSVLISSASAKTAYCLAFVIDLRRKFKQVALPKGKKWVKNKIGGEHSSPKLIGLTSKRNLKFTQELGLYDEVLTYEQVNRLTQKGDKWIYVDVAGNNGLNSKISELLGSKVIKGVSLGMSDPSGKVSGPGSNQKLELFFMVEWLAERRKHLSIKQIAQMQAGAWDALMRTCDQWIKIERIWWAGAKSWMDESKGVTDLYQECLEGSVGADRGIIMSMWKEEDMKSSDRVTAKL